MAQKRILVVRHGQSLWNIEHRWQGQADPELSDWGRKQSGAAASKIGTVDAVATSPLVRASETAEIISASIGVGPVITVDGLKERDSGDWSGKTRDEIMSKWPDWETSGYRPNGWEPDEDFLARIFVSFEALESANLGSELLVVSHSGVIITLEHHFGSPRGRIPNLAGLEVFINDGEVSIGERIMFLGDDLSTGGESQSSEL